MTRLIALLKALDRAIAAAEVVVALGSTAGMVLLVAWQVPMRLLAVESRHAIVSRLGGEGGVADALFGDFSWMTPIARFLLLWASLSGASLATRGRRHILIDVATKAIRSRRAQVAINVPASLVAVSLCIFLACVGERVVARNWTQETILRGVFLGPVQLLIPAAFAVMALRFAIILLEDLRGALTGDLAYLARYEVDPFQEIQAAHGERITSDDEAKGSAPREGSPDTKPPGDDGLGGTRR